METHSNFELHFLNISMKFPRRKNSTLGNFINIFKVLPSGKLSFWETVFLGNCLFGKLTIWKIVILDNFLLGNILWETLFWEINTSGKLPNICRLCRHKLRFTLQTPQLWSDESQTQPRSNKIFRYGAAASHIIYILSCPNVEDRQCSQKNSFATKEGWV